MNHAREVFQEAKELDEVFDCQMVTLAKENKDMIVNPIYHFTEDDIWRYARENEIEMNPLYQMGYRRVGCVGCPMATTKMREREFADFKGFRENYIKAFDRMLIARRRSGKDDHKGGYHEWNTGKDVYEWWMEYYKQFPKGQMTMDEWLKEGE